MSISERDRHELYLAVEGLIGAPVAETMMSMLPPVGWADVATKHDLAALEDRFELRFDAHFAAVDARFEAVDARFDSMEARFDARFDGMEARFDARCDSMEARFVDKETFQREMRELSQRLVLTLVGSQISLAALVVTVIGLAR